MPPSAPVSSGPEIKSPAAGSTETATVPKAPPFITSISKAVAAAKVNSVIVCASVSTQNPFPLSCLSSVDDDEYVSHVLPPYGSTPLIASYSTKTTPADTKL